MLARPRWDAQRERILSAGIRAHGCRDFWPSGGRGSCPRTALCGADGPRRRAWDPPASVNTDVPAKGAVVAGKLRMKLASASRGKDYSETVWGRGDLLRGPSLTQRDADHYPE